MISPSSRKGMLKERAMDLVTQTTILPLLFGCLGIFSLFRLLQRTRSKAYLRNAVVVVTGATSGLGKECARVFHAAGAKVVLCGRNVKALEEFTRELADSSSSQGQTHQPCVVTFDLADPGAIAPAAAEILQCFGYVDILINNAGISYRGAISDTIVDVDRKVMEINYFGPVALTKDAASKHATQAFFDCLRAEMKDSDIEVTVISPGYIHTNLSVNAVTADGSRYGALDKNTAQGRSAVEVAQDIFDAVGKKKKDVLLTDFLPTMAVYIRTLAPRLFFRIMASRARKERKSKNS
ncbi:dehydrogenase/reductase SDR family member 7B isoform X3 [Rattus norvegicus]|uniref:dehydrogenase/reductase SDR family member 7B isoform X3 n=1 Tax=Rattus norvegicus TaxID=10116 RepID=UPI0003D08F07|nr:dehydrogenase/reductase SDR family member 7B isoform X3 [Rattus norvegicus]